jgi:DNA-binding Xre family transcriptional regulator
VTVTEQVRQIMRATGKSYVKLSKELDMSLTTLHRFMTGGGSTAHTLDHLCKRLRLEVRPVVNPRV